MMTCSGTYCTGIIIGIPITGGIHTHTIMIPGTMIPGIMILGMHLITTAIILDITTTLHITTVIPYMVPVLVVAEQTTILLTAGSTTVDGTGISVAALTVQ